MLFYYPMIVHEEDGYWAEFPDLEGCNAWGDTLEELYEDAEGAMSCHIYSILADGETLPASSRPRETPTDENSFVVIMSSDVNLNPENQSVKKTLTIPAWMNKKAEQEGINFSKTLQDALVNKLSLSK